MDDRFVPHLEELRERLLRSLGVLTATTAVGFAVAPRVLLVLERPLLKYLPVGAPLVFTGITDKLMMTLKAAFLTGVVLAFPMLLWQVWGFFAAAMKPEARPSVIRYVGVSLLLFLGGIALAYFVMLPSTLQFLLSVGGDIARPMITLKDYLDFTIVFLLVSGLLFQLPVVMVLLARAGVLHPEALRGRRTHVFLGLAIACAVATPSQDAFTMAVLLVPLYGLFELSLWWIRRSGRTGCPRAPARTADHR